MSGTATIDGLPWPPWWAGDVARLRRGAVWAAGFRRVKPLRWRSGAGPFGLTRRRAGGLRP